MSDESYVLSARQRNILEDAADTLEHDGSAHLPGLVREVMSARLPSMADDPDQVRKAFQQWASGQGPYIFRRSDRPFRTYHHELTEHAWRGWANASAGMNAGERA